MPRLLGIDIPADKKIEYALRYVYGIGPSRSLIVLEKAGIDPNVRAKDMNEEQLNQIVEAISELGYVVEGDLRREVSSCIQRLKATRCYRGTRHQKGLPARGQRTKTNARTRKGAKKRATVKKK